MPGNRKGDRSGSSRRNQLERVYTRDDGICYLCKRHVPRELASRDHVVDLSEGGSREDDNVKLAHKKCNEWKSTHRRDAFFILSQHESYSPEYIKE